MTEHIDVSTSAGITTITLSSGKVNALCADLLAELEAVSEGLSRPGQTPGAVVVTGGPRMFAAGAQIAEFAADPSLDSFAIAPQEDVRALGAHFLAAMNAFAAIPAPTIASVSGYALGGGCELALAADMRIGASTAVMGLPEILLGIIPGGGGTQRLSRLVGAGRAKELIFTGRSVDADEALRIGLLNEVVAAESLDERVQELASSLSKGASHALALAKSAVDEGLETTLDAGLRIEQDRFVASFATPDAAVGVRSFLEHGPGKAEFGPRWE